jgi:hypothetical protein
VQKLWVALGLLFVFGLLVSSLDHDSLAIDEGWTMWAIRSDNPIDTLRRVDNDVHPPLYFVLLDGWVTLAGESVFASRMLSVFAALIGLAETYAVGKRLVDADTGLIALLYLGTSGFVVYYARETRMYTLLLAMSILSMWAYLRWQQKPNRTTSVIYALSLAGLLYTHYQGVWIIAVQGLHALLTRRWRWIGVGLLASLFFIPWTPSILGQFREHPVMQFGVRATTWSEIRWLIYLLTDLYWPLLLIAFLIVVFRWRPSTITLLGLWVVLPPILILAVNAWLRPSYQPRYVIGIMPGVALTMAYALRQIRWRYGVLAVLCMAHLALYPSLWPEKADWNSAVAQIAEKRQPDDPLLLWIDDYSVAAYYMRQFDFQPGIDLRQGDLNNALQATQDASSVWVMMSLNAPTTWDVTLTLDEQRHVGQRNAISTVNGIDNTIFYRFDAGDTDDLQFTFDDIFAFTDVTWNDLCFDLSLRVLRDVHGQYSAGLHLLDSERQVVSQVDAGLGAHSAGEDISFSGCVTAEPGIYKPVLVIYDWSTVKNLPVYEGREFFWGEWLVLNSFEVIHLQTP